MSAMQIVGVHVHDGRVFGKPGHGAREGSLGTRRDDRETQG